MRTVRNVAFLILVGAMMVTGQTPASAFVLDFENCPAGCTCTPNPTELNYVDIFCEEAASVDVCPYAFSECEYYCQVTLTDYVNLVVFPPVTCWLGHVDGCGPYSLDPPASLLCECLCAQ